MVRSSSKLSPYDIRNRLVPVFEDEGLKLVLLFGSSASGHMHSRSDIDLAFLYDKSVDAVALTNRITVLLHSDRVDVVDLRRASPLLRFSAVKHGKVLFEKEPGVFAEFYSLAFRMYSDARKLRDAQERSITAHLKSRGLR